ncbi:hypothetical protein IIA94_03240 [Patescibacteria group bacterium]|nr:hypothetical protein [Patescibacteria group bacterium]
MRKRQEIIDLALEIGALKYGEHTPNSEKKSKYCFDGRKICLNPKGTSLLGTFLVPMIRDAKAKIVGGLALESDLLIPEIALISQLDKEKPTIPGFVIHKKVTECGAKQIIEGCELEKDLRVAMVGITNDESLLDEISVVKKLGCEVVLVVVILDEGGGEELRKKYNFKALLKVTPEGVVVPTK